MIIKRFEEIAARYPDKVAVKSGAKALTYRCLNRTANGLGHAVLASYPGPVLPGDAQTVALLFSHGAHLAAAVLAVLKTGKTYVPFDAGYPEKRLTGMCEHFDIRLIVTVTGHMELAEKLAAAASKEVVILNMETLPHGPAENLNLSLHGDCIAYILLTSGSMGKPKGVLQTRGNLWFFVESYIKALNITPGDRVSFLSSLSHDGTVEDIYPALLSGAGLYPYDIEGGDMADMANWLAKERITVYHSVPTVFRYFSAVLNNRDRFPYLRVACLGGEPLMPRDIRVMKQFFPRARLAHMYGQTESSVNTMGLIDTANEIETVTLGRPLEGITLLLINEAGEEAEELEVGEIYVGSRCLSPGYWKNLEATAAVFFPDEELGKLYKTGDLGKLQLDGTIRFMGRKDDQLKVRGFRVEPAEIETRLLEWANLKEAAVIGKEIDGETQLCAYIVSTNETETEIETENPVHDYEYEAELKAFLSEYLPGYMIPAHIIRLDHMPLTGSGKVDRRRLPEPGPEAAKETVPFEAPRSAVEKKMAEIWQDVLRVEIKKKGINTNFFDAGGHSLKAALVIAKIHREFNVKVPLQVIFDHPTIKKLSPLINKNSAAAGEDKYLSIQPVEKKEYYRLSYNQERLWIINQLEPGNVSYHLGGMTELQGDVDGRAVEAALDTILRRHESFRTCFRGVGDKVAQFVEEDISLPFETADISSADEKERRQRLARYIEEIGTIPFDLGRAPLFRTMLVKISPWEYYLLFNMHHIISDGWSMEIVKREFSLLYEGYKNNKSRGIEWGPLRIRCKDFARWQNRHLNNPALKEKSHSYWQEKIMEGLPQFKLPRDLNKSFNTREGALCRFVIADEVKNKLIQAARDGGTSLFTVVFSLFNMLLSWLSGREEIVCGIISAGREHADLEHVVGFFVNTLLWRNHVDYEETFTAFLKKTAESTLEALRHQGYPLELVLDDLKMKFPDISVMFNMLNVRDTGNVELKGETANEPRHMGGGGDVKFDVSFQLVEYKNGIEVRCLYKKRLFEPERIEYMMRHYLKLLEEVAHNPGKKIKEYFSVKKKKYRSLRLNPGNSRESLES